MSTPNTKNLTAKAEYLKKKKNGACVYVHTNYKSDPIDPRFSIKSKISLNTDSRSQAPLSKKVII